MAHETWQMRHSGGKQHWVVTTVVVAVWASAGSCAPRVGAQDDPLTRPYDARECSTCAEWNAPHRPVHLFGNTYYVGTRGLSALLIASPEGHVLIDGALPNSAPLILENIRSLGFDPRDVRVILNSHAHFDHAAGIAALQRATGARVLASPSAALVLERGIVSADDPQHGSLLPMPRVANVERLADGEPVTVGSIAATAHFTPGHTPGGTSWSWRSCEGERCLTMVYADSLTPVSRDGFRFSNSDSYPGVLSDFERGFALLEGLPCDVLVTPHPAASSLWDRVDQGVDGLIDTDACKQYVARAREQLRSRLESEAR